MKSILIIMALMISSLSFASTVNTDKAISTLRNHFNLETNPSTTQYIKLLGNTGNGTRCVMNISNSKRSLSIEITKDSFNDGFVSFTLSTDASPKISNLKLVDMGMRMLVSSDLESSYSTLKQELIISTNTSTAYTIQMGNNKTSCLISNF